VTSAFFWLNAAFALAILDLTVHYLDWFHASNPYTDTPNIKALKNGLILLYANI
jgi:hypothetical protein